jgi:hypothetical protein
MTMTKMTAGEGHTTHSSNSLHTLGNTLTVKQGHLGSKGATNTMG